MLGELKKEIQKLSQQNYIYKEWGGKERKGRERKERGDEREEIKKEEKGMEERRVGGRKGRKKEAIHYNVTKLMVSMPLEMQFGFQKF